MFSVKGKRQRKIIPADEQSRKRGRPFKRPETRRTARSAFNAYLKEHRQKLTLRPGAGSDTHSSLELLPNELIQQVFFYCFEINLARASTRLAAVLSHESTYRALILFAFFDDDRMHQVETRQFLPAIYRPLQLEEKIRLQSGILSCRWCTFDKILSCMPDLCRLRMVQEWAREKQAELDIRQRFGDQLALSNDNSPSRRHELPDLSNSSQLDDHFAALARPTLQLLSLGHPGDTLYSPAIECWDFKVHDEENAKVEKLPMSKCSTLAARVIPDWLLCPFKWTRARLNLVQLLRQGFEFITEYPVMQISTQSLERGMASAIREGNTDALSTLLELHWTFCESKRSMDTYASLPIGLFHLAARQEDASSDLLYTLMRASADSVSYDDTILTAWALRHAAGDRAASWLLGKMSGSHSIMIRGDGSVWYDCDGTGSPVETDRSFAEDLRYFYTHTVRENTMTVPGNPSE